MKAKAAVLLSGALVALLLLSRYFALSRAGLPLGWMLYLGLPVTFAGVLFALRLLNLSAGWGNKIEHFEHNSAAWPRRSLSLPQPEGSVSERLKDLQELHAKGVISDTEYSAQRLKLIANM
jgi:hypothetical protein